MARGTVFRIGSFDVTKFSEEELWARMNSLARFYAGLAGDFRLLTYSQPYPLDAPLYHIQEMMAHAGDPRLREQIAAYRRFLEGIVQSAYLKDTAYYALLFSDKAPHLLQNSLALGLRVPVQPLPTLPSPLRVKYREMGAYAQPLRGNGHYPLLSGYYSYDIRGRLSFGTMVSFLQLPFPLYVAVDVKTVHPDRAIGTLQMKHNQLKAELLGRGTNEAPDPEVKQAFVDVELALDAVQHEQLGLHQVVVAFLVEGRTRDELAERAGMLIQTAGRNQIKLRPAFLHQLDVLALFTPQPIADTLAAGRRNMLSTGVALLAHTGHETNKSTDGPFLAINCATGSPLWLDKFGLPAYNEVTLGRTGSGKTFYAGLAAYRSRMHGVQTLFVDPQGNFHKVTEAVGGKYNRLRLGEGTALNILDVVHDHQAAQISHVVVMLETILGRKLTIREKAAVDTALVRLYHDRQVRIGQFRAGEMPLLQDLVARLESPARGDLAAPSLAGDLQRFTAGSLAGVFNAHTTLSFDLDRKYPIITFDVSDLEGEFQPAFIYALLSSIERVIRQRRSQQLPTNVVIDEFGILSGIPALAEAAGMLAKRVRAWKVGIQCLDQNWHTFDTAAGRRILENTLIKVIMRVDETAAPAIVENLGLTGHHARVILSAGQGEGIMIVGSKPYHVYFQASPAEVRMLTPYTRQATQAVQLPTRR